MDEVTGSATRGFETFVDDNFHYQDEDARSAGPRFATYDGAVEWCRARVEESLAECHQPGMSPEELLGRYKMFGEDPWIRPVPDGVDGFSAWTYAAEAAERLCGEQS